MTRIKPEHDRRREARKISEDGEPTTKESPADRAEIARELFNALPHDQRQEYAARAKTEAADRKHAFELRKKAGYPTDPAFRLECVLLP